MAHWLFSLLLLCPPQVHVDPTVRLSEWHTSRFGSVDVGAYHDHTATGRGDTSNRNGRRWTEAEVSTEAENHTAGEWWQCEHEHIDRTHSKRIKFRIISWRHQQLR